MLTIEFTESSAHGQSMSIEPAYKGKPLRYWVLGDSRSPYFLAAPNTLDPESRDAIDHIGTNAVPFLIKWIQSYRTVSAFEILGSAAKFAIPELAFLATNQPGDRAEAGASNQIQVQINAVEALGRIGPDALGALCAIATNNTLGNGRVWALNAIARCGTNAIPFVPVLLTCLRSQDNGVIAGALFALSQVRTDQEGVLAAIMPFLRSPSPTLRVNALQALASFGYGSAPSIINALHDTTPKVRATALGLLVQSMPNTLTNITVLSTAADRLDSPDPDERKWAAQLLRAAGQQARGVKPDLGVPLGGWNATFAEATNALRRLAPELLNH